jgi:hypothetical protein
MKIPKTTRLDDNRVLNLKTSIRSHIRKMLVKVAAIPTEVYLENSLVYFFQRNMGSLLSVIDFEIIKKIN